MNSWSKLATLCTTFAMSAAALACDSSRDRPDPLPAWMLKSDSMGSRLDTATTGTLARDDLTESSGAAASATQPGVVFTLNDSGNEPLLYATDSTGADRGVWRVTGARNVDWESIAVAPCAASETGARQEPRSCIYIGDTGDNAGRRPTRTIYRVPEPSAQRTGHIGATPRAERLVYEYSDGPHDVEAMYVAPDGDVFLISKRPLENAAGRLRRALVFRLPRAAWTASMTGRADLVDSLPIVPGSAPWRMITDAALAPDHRHLAVRTYTQIFLFETDTATGRVDANVAPAVCNIAGLALGGEGVTWLDARGTLLLTSEGQFAPVQRVRCPLPVRGALTVRDHATSAPIHPASHNR